MHVHGDFVLQYFGGILSRGIMSCIPVIAGFLLFAESSEEDGQSTATNCSSQGRQGEQRLLVGSGSLMSSKIQ